MLLTILLFIAILTLVVLVHELGHFLAARSLGIRVEEFGIGFPPRLMKIKKKKTIFSINAIPLGGFVKMLGEEEEVKSRDSFSEKPVGQRFLVLVSGVLANFILAILIFTFIFTVGAPLIASTSLDHPWAKRITHEVKVMFVKEKSPAAKIGLAPGDTILSIEGRKFESGAEVSDFTKKMAGKNVRLVIKKNGQEQSISVTLDKSEAPLGIAPLIITTVSYSWYQAPIIAFYESGRIIKNTIFSLGRMVKNAFTTRKFPQEVAGPVGIFFLTSEAVKLGWRFVLIFIAFISLSLAIINILPFPALDGGRLIFLGIEKLRGKRVSPRIENVIHLVGFVLLISFILFITYFDIMKFK